MTTAGASDPNHVNIAKANSINSVSVKSHVSRSTAPVSSIFKSLPVMELVVGSELLRSDSAYF
jgi:hypothetical protein